MSRKINPIWDGKVNEGIVELKDPDNYFYYLKTLNGRDVELIVRERNLLRTNPQNAYYWAVIL